MSTFLGRHSWLRPGATPLRCATGKNHRPKVRGPEPNLEQTSIPAFKFRTTKTFNKRHFTSSYIFFDVLVGISRTTLLRRTMSSLPNNITPRRVNLKRMCHERWKHHPRTNILAEDFALNVISDAVTCTQISEHYDDVTNFFRNIIGRGTTFNDSSVDYTKENRKKKKTNKNNDENTQILYSFIRIHRLIFRTS